MQNFRVAQFDMVHRNAYGSIHCHCLENIFKNAT